MRSPTERRRGRAALLALVVVLAALPIVPSLPGRPGALRIGDASFDPPAGGIVPALEPSVLATPWALRAGFNLSEVDQATSIAPATAPVHLTVTIAPSPAIWSPPARGAPRLPAAALADRFAPGPTELAALEGYLTSNGLTVTHVASDHLALELTGTSAAAGRAFRTRIVDAAVGGQSQFFPDRPPSLPAPYQAMVTAVSGLSSENAGLRLPLAPAVGHPGAGAPSTITPNDLHVIFGLNGLYNFTLGGGDWATSQGIAVLLWGSGYDPSDLTTFFSQQYPSGFPAPTVVPYPVDGAPMPSAASLRDPSNATQEMTLDIEWSASEAPGATIDAVYAPDGPASGSYSPTDVAMEDAAHEAITGIPGVTVLSMSFASPDGGDLPFEAALSQDFAEAAQRGITVLGASGDSGGTQQGQPSCGGGPDPQFPAASPYVLAVGGTAPTLTYGPFGGATGIAREAAWDDSGGGYSSQYAAPSWQLVGSAARPIEGNGSFRGMPDVAGPAAQDTFYYGGAPRLGSGTSFATPAWAGLIAEMNAIRGTPLGFLTDRLYAIGSAESAGANPGLVDITQGATCIAAATPGWDAATGWGSPQAVPLYDRLAGTFVNVTLTAHPGTVAPGGVIAVSARITNATTGAPIPSLPVQFALTGSFPGVCTNSLASSSASTVGTGTANGSVTVPTCYLGASVTITATVRNGSYLGSNSTTVSVSLLGWGGLIAISQTFPYNLLLFALIVGGAATVGLVLGRRRTPRRPAGEGTPTTGARPPAPAPPAPAPAPAPDPPPPADPPPSPSAHAPSPSGGPDPVAPTPPSAPFEPEGASPVSAGEPTDPGPAGPSSDPPDGAPP